MLLREAIGGLVRDLRTGRQLSLRGLAAEAEMSPTYLGEVERGMKELSSETLARIARALGTPVADIVAGAADRMLGDELTADGAPVTDPEALSRLRKLSYQLGSEHLRTVTKFAEFLVVARG